MKYQAKRYLNIAVALLVSLVLMSSFFAPAFAWYINRLATVVNVESSIIGSYFEQGNGTEDTPYVIARPIQMYYFAWLQDLGYFDGENDASTTSDKKYYFTLGADIDMSENPDYAVLPPIGTLEHPFVGVFDGKYHYAPTDEQGNAITDQFDPNNTKEGTYHVISNLKVSNDELSNVPEAGEENMQFVGLFGVVGSMEDISVVGEVKNFGLYNLTVETKSPIDDKTIIGIVAGYCNGVFEGVGVSNCRVTVKNGLSPKNVTTYQTNADTGEVTSSNVTPETLSFSLVGFSDKTYQAYNISPVAGGNEFGGSLAMESVYNKILSAKNNANAKHLSYNITKVVNIDENGVRTESYSNEIDIDFHRSMANYQNIYYLSEYELLNDGDIEESYSLVDRYSSSTTTVISDGLGNYLQGYYSGGTYGLRNTTDLDSATKWIISTSGSYYRLHASINGSTRYLYYNNGLTLSTSTYNWSITNTDDDYQHYLIKSYSGNNYITYDNEWTTSTSTNSNVYMIRFPGSEVTQYMYLNGGKTIEREQVVTTITKTKYDAYLIQDGNGNYLVGSPSGISSTTNSNNATAWRFSNGASGGTFTIQDEDEVTYYLYNNNGTLQVSSTNSTNWTISNGQITNGGYYLVYLDGTWKLWEETTYYAINDGNGTYLNFSNGSITNGQSSTTKWHIASNKIYTYNGTTKTYLYNNNGTLTTTTNSGTASTWTVDNTNNTIKSGNYYLMFLDGTWNLLAETTYYAINDGAGHYLNYSGDLTSGASMSTRWHIDANNKIYFYNNTTKTYLYNNNGTLTTTTNSSTASTWMVDNANHSIKSGNYYLCYNDNAWGLTKETNYYLINDGNGIYLNLTNGSFDSGTSQTATRWFVVDGKIYSYQNGTATYLYNNGGVLDTTTSLSTASIWTLSNGQITNGGYYLCYNDSAWGLTEETEYCVVNDGNGNYLNLTNGEFVGGTSQTATRWYYVNGKLYTYVAGIKTYLYNNAGALETTTNSSTALTWTVANNNIKNGSYYLVYQNGWIITTETDYYLISDGSGNYFNLTSAGIEIGTSQTATNWHFADGASGGKIYTYIDGTATYLYNNAGALETTTNSSTASTWTVANNNITNNGYNLVYQNTWLITNETGYYLINDGNGNYLNLTSSGFEVGTSQTATGWHFTNGATGGKIYTYVNGTKAYLYNNGGILSTTTNSGTATTWSVSNGQITNNGYYIVYLNNWKLTNVSSYYTISDADGHYLNLTSNGFEVGTIQNATDWQITNTSSGKIYTYVNNVETYLYNNSGNLTTTTNSGIATTWTIDQTNDNIKNNGYYLTFDSSWILTDDVSYYLISDNKSHCLNLTYTNSQALTAVGTSSNATVWKFSNKSSGGNISAEVNGTTYYLNYVDGNMVPQTTASTLWTASGNKIYCTNNSSEYDMFYDGTCWTLILSTLNSYYLISDNSSTKNYIDCSSDSLGNTTIRSYATKWTFDEQSSWFSTSYNIYTVINGTTKYLHRVNNTTVDFSTTSTSWTISGNNISYNYRQLYYSSGWKLTRNSANTSIISVSSSTKTSVKTANDVQYDLIASIENGNYNLTNSVSSSNYDLSVDVANNQYNLIANAPTTQYNVAANTQNIDFNITANANSSNYDLTADFVPNSYDITNEIQSTTTVWKNTVNSIETVEVKGKETYIPLATNEDGSTSLRNTGYIVSGSNYADKETYAGDIRVSYYAMSNLYRALGYSSDSNVSYSSSRLEIVTRTYLSNGSFVRISDSYNSSNRTVNSDLSSTFSTKSTVTDLGLEKYTESRAQLEETLSGSSNVYGLHFMDAQISKNNLINIGKATINGSTYSNYKMPQDCIDFNLNTKGSLNFYAGTYFPGNTAFFSLHHIIRNEGEIVSISEIDKIYGNPNNTAKSYIYKYVGESTPTLPDGYVLMFDTDWIKNPTMVEYAMYYFEIPVNAGEYALGSVNGSDGAYLIYLDIGATGKSLADGTTLETSIKGIDFVSYSNLSSNVIATTLGEITNDTASSAVIILKNNFQGDIIFNIQDVTVDDAPVLRIGYTLSDTSAKDYVKWTKASASVDVVDNTVYT